MGGLNLDAVQKVGGPPKNHSTYMGRGLHKREIRRRRMDEKVKFVQTAGICRRQSGM